MGWERLQSVWKETGGNVTMVFGLCAVPVFFAAFGAVELGQTSSERGKLQAAVDAGALAGAGRLSVATSSGDTGPTDRAVSITLQTLANENVTSSVVLTPSIAAGRGSLTMTSTADHKALIGFMGFGDQKIIVTATAETLGSVPLCVLQTGAGGINLQGTARVRATGCAVHANEDITVGSSAMLQATRTQATGTVTGPVSPQGNSGALAITDPFLSMDLTAPTDCIGKVKKIKQSKGTTETLAAGVHCEEYVIDKNATLILAPGEHYFMDDLNAKSNAIIRGDDVVLVFGSTKKINFADNASVQLGARKTGPFAGFLIVTTRDNHEKFTIASDHVSKLLGTIYIPNAELDVATAGNVAQDSAWSIIVADTLTLTQNPVLVINNSYVGSGIPVPDGVGPNGDAPRLTR